jgi:hypothetical protein
MKEITQRIEKSINQDEEGKGKPRNKVLRKKLDTKGGKKISKMSMNLEGTQEQ